MRLITLANVGSGLKGSSRGAGLGIGSTCGTIASVSGLQAVKPKSVINVGFSLIFLFSLE